MEVGLFVAPAALQPALTSVRRCGTFEPVRLGYFTMPLHPPHRAIGARGEKPLREAAGR